MAVFGDFGDPSRMREFDDYLLTRSYVEGYGFSEADRRTFAALKAPPEDFVNALRWYTHIKALLGDATRKPVVAEPQDDDVDLFGSDDEEDEKLKKERAKGMEKQKSKPKAVVVAKSLVVLEVKPWEDSTDLEEMKRLVRSIEKDGLVWGTDKFVPIGYGIRKLSIACVVEDEKVSVDDLCEEILEIGDYVQSVDIASFNKL